MTDLRRRKRESVGENEERRNGRETDVTFGDFATSGGVPSNYSKSALVTVSGLQVFQALLE
jgi:hypothetical protein